MYAWEAFNFREALLGWLFISILVKEDCSENLFRKKYEQLLRESRYLRSTSIT